MSIVIQNGRVLDPATNLDQVLDLVVQDGVITQMGSNLSGDTVIDAQGCWVTPGLIDLHVHLRQPGFEYKETVATGTAAAAAGGYTAVCCMANTKPVADNAAVIQRILQLAQQAGFAHVYPIGAVSKGLKGEELAELGELAQAGCAAFSDDGRPVMSGRLMRLAMQYAWQFGRKIIVHAEDLDLADGGLMNEGPTATRLGLRGIPAAAEEAMIARDIILSRSLNIPVHIAHVSTAGSVQLLRQAKACGVQVTAETAPHYLAATDALCQQYNGNCRVNPPLRGEQDSAALIEGLLDGTIDCIATDHAPHHQDEKMVEFELAASGISGIETAFGLVNTTLQSKATPLQIVKWMSTAPAEILGLPGGRLAVGQPADIAVLDPDYQWTVNPDAFISKGHNTPFGGWHLVGKARHVLLAGQPTLANGQLAKAL